MGSRRSLEPAGYSGLIVNTDNDPGREEWQIDHLRARQVEGLIVATARVEHPLMEQLHRDGVVMVMVNRRPEGVDVPSITPDDAAGVQQAIRHLAELGHTRIAHVAGPANTSTGVTRARAFRSALHDLGLDDDPRLVTTTESWSEDAGAAGLRRLLDGGAEFTGIFAGNDLIALGCYDVFRERGIDCPVQMSVVGFNDMPFLDKLQPPLTTIAIPHQQIGAEAARLLLDAIADPTPAGALRAPAAVPGQARVDRTPGRLNLPRSFVRRSTRPRSATQASPPQPGG